jgi:hypothetical protein
VAQKPLTNTSKGSAPAPWTPDDKASLATEIGRVFDVQKQFGKTTAQLANVIEGFCWAMKPYPAEHVIWGFSQYILNHSDMPTPSDIVKLIDPKPPAFKPDAPYYISLKKIHKEQGPYGLTLEEIEYVSRYEAHMQTEMKHSRGDD